VEPIESGVTGTILDSYPVTNLVLFCPRACRQFAPLSPAVARLSASLEGSSLEPLQLRRLDPGIGRGAAGQDEPQDGHTGTLKAQTHLSPESHDEAVPLRQSVDAWIRRSGGDPVRLPPGANVCTGGRPAAGGGPPGKLGLRCGHARIEQPSSARS